jgi:biopolymer transport protein ExbD
MPRVKVARKSTAIDMTAMCDVAFLLLTFFILTAKPKVEDPSKAEVPTSSKEKLVPEENLATISVGQSGKIFYSLTGNDNRVGALTAMGEKYHITFTPEEQTRFAVTEIFGVPMNQLKAYLDTPPGDIAKFDQKGIQSDTTGNSELSNWILTSRQADRGLHGKDLDIAIRGDKKELYPVISTIIITLEKQKKFKFALITDLKTAPKTK